MRIFWRAGLPAFLFLICAQAQAATVNTLNNKLLVSSGDGFHEVGPTVPAKPGDLIMGGKDGSGEILYDNGCRVKVNPGEVVTVLDVAPCQTGEMIDGPLAVGLLAAVGAGVGLAIAESGPSSP